MFFREFKFESPKLWDRYVTIVLVVSLYWIISITMVFLNKSVLSEVDAPFFITWFQCLIAVLIFATFRILIDFINGTTDVLSEMETGNEKSSSGTNPIVQVLAKHLIVPTWRLRWAIILRILPLSTVFVAMIAFNNMSLQYVGVAFYFIGRSLTPVFNVLFTYMILGKRTSYHAIGCCIGIIIGFALGVDQEQLLGTLSITGVICGILASMFVSLNSIYVADMLNVVEQNACLLSYYNSASALILFIPLILAHGELDLIIDGMNLGQLGRHFWWTMFLGGICGLLIGIVTNLQIKYTSPLSHNISGTAKACTQTVLATYVFQETKTPKWWLSNGIVLAFSALYTYVKQQEMRRQAEQQEKHDNDELAEKLLPPSTNQRMTS